MSRVLPMIGLLCLGLSGCETGSKSPVTVTDSAGIRIVMSDPRPGPYATVEPDPILSLGGSEAEGPAQFFRIRDIHVDPRGRLWVADGESAEIRIFLPTGTHLRTVGGRGEGPGEFQRIHLLGSFRGDSVAAWDDGLSRLTILDGDGDLARTEQVVPRGGDPSIRCRDVFQDGSLLGQVPTILSAGSLEPGQILGDSARLVRYFPEDSTQRPWADGLGPRWLWTGRSQIPLPFNANAGFDLRGEELHLVSGSEFQVRVFKEGQLVRVYGMNQDPRRVSEADVEAYRRFVMEFLPEGSREDYLSSLGSPDLPEYLPAYSGVLVSSSGHVWAQVYSPDARASGSWHVFDEGGVWLGAVETPVGLRVRHIADDRITGVWLDATGVEHVRVYRLHPGEEAGS